MTGYLKYRFRFYQRRERFLSRFFRSVLDPAAPTRQKAFRAEFRREREEASSSSLKDPKEEPAEDVVVDLENRKYSFYLRPLGGGV
jgi:hypothetical protein